MANNVSMKQSFLDAIKLYDKYTFSSTDVILFEYVADKLGCRVIDIKNRIMKWVVDDVRFGIIGRDRTVVGCPITLAVIQEYIKDGEIVNICPAINGTIACPYLTYSVKMASTGKMCERMFCRYKGGTLSGQSKCTIKDAIPTLIKDIDNALPEPEPTMDELKAMLVKEQTKNEALKLLKREDLNVRLVEKYNILKSDNECLRTTIDVQSGELALLDGEIKRLSWKIKELLEEAGGVESSE